MKQPSELPREQLADIVGRIRDVLWLDTVTGELDPDRSWSVETIEWVSGVVGDAGLKPDPVRPESRTAEGAATPRLPRPPCNDIEEPPVAAMRTALEAFIRTIEATGGCIRPGRRTINLPGQEIVEFDSHFPVPATVEDWPDLAESYLQACRALGREPMLRDMDADEIPDDGGDAGEA
jgi:hypothetical protein